MSLALYRANIVAASMHALASLLVCSTYELWLPHPVGFIFPALAALTSGAWAIHCWLLGIAAANEQPKARGHRLALVPLTIALIAGVACWVHYQQEIPKDYKIIEWFRKNAA